MHGTAKYASRCSWLFQAVALPYAELGQRGGEAFRVGGDLGIVDRGRGRTGPGDAFAVAVDGRAVAQDRGDGEREVLHGAGEEHATSGGRPATATGTS